MYPRLRTEFPLAEIRLSHNAILGQSFLLLGHMRPALWIQVSHQEFHGSTKETLSGIDCYTQHMLKYNELKTRPREFLASTGLKRDEFEQLLPAFRAAYEKKSPPDLTQEGTPRQRQFGGGAKGALPEMADKLFFILVYHKTQPLQTMHGLPCGLSQPQAHCWIHRLLPILQHALRDLGEAPERDARRVAVSPLALAGGPPLQVDGTERRRQRPKDDTQQKAH